MVKFVITFYKCKNAYNDTRCYLNNDNEHLHLSYIDNPNETLTDSNTNLLVINKFEDLKNLSVINVPILIIKTVQQQDLYEVSENKKVSYINYKTFFKYLRLKEQALIYEKFNNVLKTIDKNNLLNIYSIYSNIKGFFIPKEHEIFINSIRVQHKVEYKDIYDIFHILNDNDHISLQNEIKDRIQNINNLLGTNLFSSKEYYHNFYNYALNILKSKSPSYSALFCKIYSDYIRQIGFEENANLIILFISYINGYSIYDTEEKTTLAMDFLTKYKAIDYQGDAILLFASYQMLLEIDITKRKNRKYIQHIYNHTQEQFVINEGILDIQKDFIGVNR